MEKVIVEIEIKDGKAVASLDKTAEKVEGIGKAAEKSKKGVKNFGKTVGNLTKSLGIVGLLAAAFQVLQEAFKNNQQVMDAVSTATTALGIAFNDLFRFITDNITPVTEFFADLFENPVENIKAFGDAIKENLIERFNSWLDTIGFLASAVKKLFAGDVAGAFEEVKNAGKEMVDVFTGVDGAFDKIGETISNGVDAVVDYTTATVEMAGAITQAEKSLVILENTQTRVREKADRDAERQRQIRDDYTKGIDERIAANIKLGEILEEQQKNELAAVDAQIAALSLRLSLDSQNQDLKNQIYALNTERFAVEAQQEGFRSEQQINFINLEKEKLELLGFQTAAEFEANALKVQNEKETQDALNKIADDTQAREKLAAETQFKLAKEEQNAKVSLALGAANAIQSLSAEGSEAGKAAAVAATIINTIQGAQAAFAQTVGGIGIKIAAAAVASAIGLANVKRIISTKVPGGKSSSQAVPTAANIAPPTFNAPTNDNNQLAASIGNEINNRPVKAYVVSGDVTTAQQMDRITNDNATL